MGGPANRTYCGPSCRDAYHNSAERKTAIYARYSTDMQSGASSDDQFRVCERLAERHGFSVVGKFSDRAISGGTAQRPRYQDLLRAARRRVRRGLEGLARNGKSAGGRSHRLRARVSVGYRPDRDRSGTSCGRVQRRKATHRPGTALASRKGTPGRQRQR